MRRKTRIKVFKPRTLKTNEPMSLSEAQQYLPKMSQITLMRKVRSGKLETTHIGEGEGKRYFVTPQAIEEYINNLFV